MERLRRLGDLWSFLPAFRAAAESEHLPTAAGHLHVTAPAISRSIRLLEEQLGVELFVRVGRRLSLSETGQVFLGHVREAMRLLDDGVQLVKGQEWSGPLRVAGPGGLADEFLLPAMEALLEASPGLEPDISEVDGTLAHDRLLAGRLDALLTETPIPHPDLEVERLGEVRYSVHCGEGHPLYRKRKVSRERLLEYSFVAPTVGVDDGWPKELLRQVGLRVWANDVLPGVCKRGDYLAMLAEPSGRRTSLFRVPVDIATEKPLYCVYRRPLGEGVRSRRIVTAIRTVLARVG